MLVLKTTSPSISPRAPKAPPVKTVPFSSASFAVSIVGLGAAGPSLPGYKLLLDDSTILHGQVLMRRVPQERPSPRRAGDQARSAGSSSPPVRSPAATQPRTESCAPMVSRASRDARARPLSG